LTRPGSRSILAAWRQVGRRLPMPKQGDLSLLSDPVAKELLQSTRLALSS
jgi:hypothetical protein